jgi:hypothetical protein
MKYSDVIVLLEKSGNARLYVTVHYVNGRYEWMPVDKAEYLRQLKMISNPSDVAYPCRFEVEKDDEMYIHSKWESEG